MDKSISHEEEYDLAALAAGDKAEFARLVDRTSSQVYRLALRMLGSVEDAEDVLQETYLKALRALPGFAGRSSLNTWLYRIAVNEALMLMRRRRPTFSLEDDGGDDSETPGEPRQIVDFCCMPEAELLSSEARRFLDRAVQQLSPGLRAVFLLRDVEGLSIKETAEALDLTEMNVKTRLLRARLKMREELSGYYGAMMKDQPKHDD
jgi:RNA polymerase sigma-70 factor (ECF subfamily)